MALSDTTVRRARITGNDYSLGDTDGLLLNVTARGGKIWYFRCYWAGKQRRMSLGSYPQISLKDALGRRDEARALKKNCRPWGPMIRITWLTCSVRCCFSESLFTVGMGSPCRTMPGR